MGETATSNSVLEVSVSFGRFENDSLSWEKWSSFSPNKYLEEVEKCATPGSVAKKAAYFEAHYKKIAARKAELLDQEKQMDNDSSSANNQTRGDLNEDNDKIKSESDVSDYLTSDRVVNQETNLANEVTETLVDEANGGDNAVMVEFQDPSTEGTKEEVEKRLESSMSDKPDDAEHVSVKEEVENASTGIEDVKEFQGKETEHSTNIKEDNVKLGRSKDSHKVTPLNKEKNISRIKKKPASPLPKASCVTKSSPVIKASCVTKSSPVIKASPVTKSLPVIKASPATKLLPVIKASPITRASPVTKSSPVIRTSLIKKALPITKASAIAKAPQLSTPRVSKPAPTSAPISLSRSSTKIGNGSSLSRSTNPPAQESKKVAPKSLHMSFSLGPSSSDEASLTSSRKSFIMEKMGDKDIVKRAFRTFQKNYYQLKPSGEEQSPVPKQVPVKVAEPKVSTSMIPRKEYTGSFEAAGVEKSYFKTAPPSLALKIAEKRREFSKKLEGKSNPGGAERPQLLTKSKEDKEVGINKVRHTLSSKATSTPGLYHGRKISQGSLDQDGSRSGMHCQPGSS